MVIWIAIDLVPHEFAAAPKAMSASENIAPPWTRPRKFRWSSVSRIRAMEWPSSTSSISTPMCAAKRSCLIISSVESSTSSLPVFAPARRWGQTPVAQSCELDGLLFFAEAPGDDPSGDLESPRGNRLEDVNRPHDRRDDHPLFLEDALDRD